MGKYQSQSQSHSELGVLPSQQCPDLYINQEDRHAIDHEYSGNNSIFLYFVTLMEKSMKNTQKSSIVSQVMVFVEDIKQQMYTEVDVWLHHLFS